MRFNWLSPRCRVSVSGEGNTVSWRDVREIRDSKITVVGNGNTVTIHPEARIDGLAISVRGDSNEITIGPSQILRSTLATGGSNHVIRIGGNGAYRELVAGCSMGDGGSIQVGEATEVSGDTKVYALEGTSVTIGDRCLFSGGIHIRSGDSHSITDLQGRRINPPSDITIASHVWIGRGVTVLKGVFVAESCVLATQSVVTQVFDSPHCVIAGNPARVVREDVDWRVEAIPWDEDAALETPNEKQA